MRSGWAVVVLLSGCVEAGASRDGGMLALSDAPSTAADDASVGGSEDAAALDDAATTTDDDATADDAGLDAVIDILDAAPPRDAEPPTSAGCSGGAGLSEGERSFMLEGRARRYILRLPRGYTRERAWPVVLALHGNGGSVSYWDGTGGDRNIRGVLQDDAILVVAEAIDGDWRDYDMPAATWPARIDSELLYFDTVLAELRSELCVRDDALFAMGFSGGGSFSGVLACRRSDIRAIAVGGSVVYFDRADCVGRSAAWITIGTQELSSDRETYRDFFRERAGCAATSTPTAPAPCVRYAGCAAGTPVDYCQHPGGHIWPPFGTQAMWDFFRLVLSEAD